MHWIVNTVKCLYMVLRNKISIHFMCTRINCITLTIISFKNSYFHYECFLGQRWEQENLWWSLSLTSNSSWSWMTSPLWTTPSLRTPRTVSLSSRTWTTSSLRSEMRWPWTCLSLRMSTTRRPTSDCRTSTTHQPILQEQNSLRLHVITV